MLIITRDYPEFNPTLSITNIQITLNWIAPRSRKANTKVDHQTHQQQKQKTEHIYSVKT